MLYFIFFFNIVIAADKPDIYHDISYNKNKTNSKQDYIINKIKNLNKIDCDNIFIVYNYNITNLLDKKLISNYSQNTTASYSDPEKSNYKYFNIILLINKIKFTSSQ